MFTFSAAAVLSGLLGPQTVEYSQGSNLCFDALNQKDKFFLTHHDTGAAHTAAIFSLAVENKTTIFGPVTGDATFCKKFRISFDKFTACYTPQAHLGFS